MAQGGRYNIQCISKATPTIAENVLKKKKKLGTNRHTRTAIQRTTMTMVNKMSRAQATSFSLEVFRMNVRQVITTRLTRSRLTERDVHCCVLRTLSGKAPIGATAMHGILSAYRQSSKSQHARGHARDALSHTSQRVRLLALVGQTMGKSYYTRIALVGDRDKTQPSWACTLAGNPAQRDAFSQTAYTTWRKSLFP